jgi:hypothetical protein
MPVGGPHKLTAPLLAKPTPFATETTNVPTEATDAVLDAAAKSVSGALTNVIDANDHTTNVAHKTAPVSVGTKRIPAVAAPIPATVPPCEPATVRPGSSAAASLAARLMDHGTSLSGRLLDTLDDVQPPAAQPPLPSTEPPTNQPPTQPPPGGARLRRPSWDVPSWDVPAALVPAALVADLAAEIESKAAVTIQARVRGKSARDGTAKLEASAKAPSGTHQLKHQLAPVLVSEIHVAESLLVGCASVRQLESMTEAEAEAEVEAEAAAQTRFLDPVPPTTTQGPAISPRRRKASLGSLSRMLGRKPRA